MKSRLFKLLAFTFVLAMLCTAFVLPSFASNGSSGTMADTTKPGDVMKVSANLTLHSNFDYNIIVAVKDGVKLKITSAYRTIATQTRLYNNGLTSRLNKGMSYEAAVAERNLYNAEPGKSEHNLGLALDFISGGSLDESFARSSQAAWLEAHAHEYGFILRYEADKVDVTKIAWEPWHYRYVGVEAATAMHERGVCLEEYFKNYYTVSEQ